MNRQDIQDILERAQQLIREPAHFASRVVRSARMFWLYWNTIDADWSTIAMLMHFQIRRTRLHIAKHQLVDDWEHICRQMLIAETLLKRMLDEPYYEHANRRYGFAPASILDDLNKRDRSTRLRRKFWSEHIHSVSKQDAELLGKIIGKYLRSWWD